MSVIKAEVTFMVMQQNGTGHTEKRILDLSQQDFDACNNTVKKEQIKGWAKMMFPSAKDVKIQFATKK